MSEVHCLYHIHLPANNDLSDGYIGCTKQLDRRMVEHRFEARRQRRPIKLYEVMRATEIHVTTLCYGSREYILELEEKLRPLPDMGWNGAVGGSEAGGNIWKGKKRPEHAEAMKEKGFQKGNSAGDKPVYAEGFIFPSRMVAHKMLGVDYKTIYNRIKNPKFDYSFI